MSAQPIDAVITWVDGSCLYHQQKRKPYMPTTTCAQTEGNAPTRFAHCGEIDFCVRSLLYFAPWLRRIYIITDQQQPALMQRIKTSIYRDKVALIDHREIFSGYEHLLPTFNSLAIETMLWRIKGLSKNFIYLNDDIFIIKPIQPEDFFTKKGIVVRGTWKRQRQAKFSTRLKNVVAKFKCCKPEKPNMHRSLQERSARLAGFSKVFFHLPHEPLAVSIPIVQQFFKDNPDHLAANAAYKIRNENQFWPFSLSHHLALGRQQALENNSLQAVMVNGATHDLPKIKTRLARARASKNVAFLCMQSLDQAEPETRSYMLQWMDDIQPIKDNYELFS